VTVKLRDVEISKAERRKLQASFERDLLSLFKQLEEEALRLAAQSVEEGWTPEDLIAKIDDLIVGDDDMGVRLAAVEKELLALMIRMENTNHSRRSPDENH
jgi:hypothetical protein